MVLDEVMVVDGWMVLLWGVVLPGLRELMRVCVCMRASIRRCVCACRRGYVRASMRACLSA